MELLREFYHLKSDLSTAVENALSVSHNLPDHNHNAQEAKWIYTRVRTIRNIYYYAQLSSGTASLPLVAVCC